MSAHPPATPPRGIRPRVVLARGRLTNASRLVMAAIIGLSFLLSGILIPVAAHLPHWIEFELVLGVWWGVWLIVTSVLLYRGVGVDDDMPEPTFSSGASTRINKGCSDPGLAGCDIPAETSCGEAGAALLVIVLVLLSVWLLVEFVIPAVAFAAYWMIVRLLGKVVNDRKDCRGSAGRSALWGFVWATTYTLPLALIVCGFHFLRHHA